MVPRSNEPRVRRLSHQQMSRLLGAKPRPFTSTQRWVLVCVLGLVAGALLWQ